MLTSRHSIVAIGTVCLATALAAGQVDPQARRAIESMAEAVKEARTISYEVKVKGEGAFFGMLPAIEGTVHLKRIVSENPEVPGVKAGDWQMRIEGRQSGGDGLKASEFLVVSDGARYIWVDDERRQLIYRPHAAVRGQPFDSVAMLQIPHLTDPAGIERQLSMPTITLVEQKPIDGATCDVVMADPGQQQLAMQYSIARTDGIPREAKRILPGLNSSQTWTITNVQVDAEIADNMFTLAAPDGYAVIGKPRPAPAPGETTTDGNADSGEAGETTTSRPVTPAAPANVPKVVGTDVGNIAPDFELSNPEGEKITLSSLKGNVVLLDFWGTWCLPCKRSSPEIQKVHSDYNDKGVKVFGLAVRETDDANPIKYMKDNNYTYGTLLRADDVAKQFRVRLYPTFIVIDQEGIIAHIESSFHPDTTFANIRQAIDRALASSAKPLAIPAGEEGDGR